MLKLAPSRAAALCIVLLFLGSSAWAEEPAAADAPAKRVLVIGIDGCRFDALQQAETPHLDALIENGAFDGECQIVSDDHEGSDTMSAPGWASILTGVWVDKHGIFNNGFYTPHFDEYPHFFARVKEAYPQAETASILDWEPIHTHMLSAADVDEVFIEADYATGDIKVAETAVEYFNESDPTAAFVYFGQVDEAGHAHGFHPTVPEYLASIEQVDAYIGQVLAAVEGRETYEQEDWLVIVVSDHGGQGVGHGGGRQDPEVRNTTLIVSGPSAARGEIEGITEIVDVPSTVFAHLGIQEQEEWGLEGKPVGLAQEEPVAP